MAGDAGFEHAVQFRQNLLEVMRRHHAAQFFGSLVMRHREIVIGRGKTFRLLSRHRLPVHKKSEMRLGESLRAFEILFDESRDNRLDGLQVLQHDSAMLTAGFPRYPDRKTGVRNVYDVMILNLDFLGMRTSP